MPKFRVRDTFEITDRNLSAIAGPIVEGQVGADMFVRIPLFSSHGIQLRIHCIEFARRHDGEDVCLCIERGPHFAQLLRGLNIAGQTLEVTANPSA
jgi:hypothetical protein